MAITGIVRYSDLISQIPKGSFYDGDGDTIPYYSKDRKFRLQVPVPNTPYALYINETYSGEVSADPNGNVEFSRKLPLGEVEIKIVNRNTGRPYSSYLTCRNYATWLASYAEALETIDDNIQRVYDSLKIEEVQSGEIEEVYGESLGVFRNFGGIDLDSYRWLVHELRLGYRNFGSRYKGLDNAISAFTQVPPFGFTRRKWGPNWRLNTSFLHNSGFTERSHTIEYALTGADPEIEGVTLVKAEPSVYSNPAVNNSISYDSTTNELTWEPGGTAGVPVELAGDGEYFLPGNPGYMSAYIIGLSGPFSISATDNDRLYLDIDNLGIIEIQLTLGGGVALATIVTDINTALNADPRYGAVYATLASVYNGSLLLMDPTATYDASIRIVSGPDITRNAAGTLFELKPGYTVFDSNLAAGIEIIDVYGGLIYYPSNLSINLDYNGALTPPRRLRFRCNVGGYGAYVSVGSDGIYTLIDSLGNICKVRCAVDSMAASTNTYTFDIGVDHLVEIEKQYNGIWVNVDVSLLPGANRACDVTVYDDETDGYIETPDNWYIEGNSAPGIANGYIFLPSKISNIGENNFGPVENFSYTFIDFLTPGNQIDFIGKAEQFPLLNGLPRGGNYPQKSFGLIYDYEGFELKFSCWLADVSGFAQTVTLSVSFDGGDNWVSGTPTALSVYPTATAVLEYEYFEMTTKIPSEIALTTTNWYGSGILVKINIAGVTPKTGVGVSFDSPKLEVKYITSDSLGNNTVPRTRHRQNFGELVYVWSPEALTLTEKQYLGVYYKKSDKNSPFSGITIDDISLDTPAGTGSFEFEYNSTGPTYKARWSPNGDAWSAGLGWVSISGSGTYTFDAPSGSYIDTTIIYDILPTFVGTMPVTKTKSLVITDLTTEQGHSRFISPAHSSLDVLDVTEYNADGTPKNLKGSITEADFSNCTIVNCDFSAADPFKFSYVYPLYENQTGETLSFIPAGPDYVASLSYDCDEDQEAAVLLEDGIPVPNSYWVFASSTTVQITGAYYNSSATYTINYNLLYQVTTDAIDLGVDFEDYSWLVDYCLWNRFDNEKGEYPVTVPVYFNKNNGRALISKPSTANKSTARLIVDLGTETVDIAKRFWRFISDNIVEIDISQLVTGQYYLIHSEKRVYEVSNLNITFEHRSADSVPNLLLASWSSKERNENVSTSSWPSATAQRYHQLRISISNIRTTKDFRLRSLVMKGLHIHGASPSVSGLTNLWNYWS